ARNEKGELQYKPFPLLTELVPEKLPRVAGLDNAKLKVFDDFKANLRQVWAAVKAKKSANEMPRMLGDKDETREIEMKDGDETVKVPVIFVTQKTYDALKERIQKENKEPPNLLQTTLQSDLATLRNRKGDDQSGESQLEKNLKGLTDWWNTQGLPNFSADEQKLDAARLHGAKTALLYTAVVPAILAVGFLLLIVYFAMAGGYKQVHLEEPPLGEY
ncbi:MAG TPA: hypothetical protein VKE74_00285, partial [Gemmataceae bacterium]|nr:hypothetical protein [Gemmataceae bacterium]